MDEVKVRLTKYLDALEAGITKGGEFAQEQAPEVAREIIGWHIADNLMWFVFLLLVGALCYGLARASKSAIGPMPVKQPGEMHFEFDPKFLHWAALRFLSVFIPLAISVAVYVAAFTSGMAAVKGLIAPRLVVIEKIREELR